MIIIARRSMYARMCGLEQDNMLIFVLARPSCMRVFYAWMRRMPIVVLARRCVYARMSLHG
jgi:hypothetical protein